MDHCLARLEMTAGSIQTRESLATDQGAQERVSWQGSRVSSLQALCRILGSVLPGAEDHRRVPRAVPSSRWAQVALVADEHLLAGALFEVLRDQDAVRDVPAEVLQGLGEAQRMTVFQNLRFKHQLRTIIGSLNKVGVVPLVLKGGAFLLDGTLDCFGARGMYDVDLLVRPAELGVTQEILSELGYRAVDVFDAAQHAGCFESESQPGVDLHRQLGGPAITSVLSTADAYRGSVHHDDEGLSYITLNPTHTVIYNVAHAQLESLQHAVASVPVRQLYTYATYVAHHRDAVDWGEVATRFRLAGRSASLEAHTELVARLFGVKSPIASTFRSRLHYARCLATFVSPAFSDVPRNIYFAFEPSYLRDRYGAGSVTSLRIRHARTLWSERRTGVLDQSFAKHAS